MVARILRSRIYIGKIESKKNKNSYGRQHKAIIGKEMFREVQSLLDENLKNLNETHEKNAYLLSGKIFDNNGNVFKNLRGTKKQGAKISLLRRER